MNLGLTQKKNGVIITKRYLTANCCLKQWFCEYKYCTGFYVKFMLKTFFKTRIKILTLEIIDDIIRESPQDIADKNDLKNRTLKIE
ncbi:hypothetical protein JCM19376_01630 [Fusibacter bizertensis]